MTYANETDLERFGLPTPTLEGIDSPTKAAALDAASQIADGYLRSAYVLPLSAYGADLTRHVVAIAVYDLLTRRGFDVDAGTDEHVRLRYQDAIRWLEQIAGGRIKPFSIVDSTPATREGRARVSSGEGRGW